MTATQLLPLRRARTALAALAVATSSTVALATGPSAVGAATTAEPIAPTTRYEYESKGRVDTTVVDLAAPTGPSSRAATGGPAAGTTGWTTQVDLVPGTEMVAITWDTATSAPDGELEIRSRTAGTWSAWDHAHADDDDGDANPGSETRTGTGVIWLGQEGADAVELRVEIGPLTGLKVLRMRSEEGVARAVTAAPESRTTTSRAVAKPTIHPRSDWASGGWKYTTNGCASGPQIAESLKHAVVHHTAGGNSYSAAQVPNVIDAIYAYHTRSTANGGRGWCDIAYNFLVDKYGGIWQGRTGDMAKPVVGGHAQGFNTGSVGLNLIGNYETATPSSVMMDSAARFLAWKLSLHGLDPKANVTLTSAGNPRYTQGTKVTVPVINYHGQTGYTECPGKNVIAKMPALRDATAWYMAGNSPSDPPPSEPPPPAIDWSPFASAEDLVWKQYVDFRRDPGLYEDRKWWFTELKAGRTNRNALVAALIRSPYVEDKSLDAVRLYLTYFGRIPDSAGIKYWWSEVDAGRNIRTVSARFSGSPEFKKTYGNLNDTEFVKLVYRNVLGRSASQADLDYWVGQITSGKDSRGGVMALFSKTKEYKDRSRTVVEVILVHQVMLGRAISAQSHMQWVAKTESEGIGSLIGTLFSSDEYRQRVGG